MYNNRLRQRGVTIVELIMFIVIVGVAAAGILQVMNLTSRNSTDPIRRKQATLIAEAYMEELQQAQFTACDPNDQNAGTASNSAVNPNDVRFCAANGTVERFGPENGNARPFDNVNDYVPVNYVEGTSVRAFAVADANGVLVDRDASGAPLGAALGVPLTNFVTTLALRNTTLNGIASPAIANPNADMTVLLITITVAYGPGESVVLEAYRTRYAPESI
ncbi:type II secretion system GspH family protein [Duganella sp. sic0402]|uniref:type II secretion system protein n=1 Tax=Duganella sp. sic0402 TaxID=2854786 RepID=UPI001C456095|nr:type II secretion system protein [Duganella sp. sic0402]MBV7534383.1 type II secretion system GspH family protein [Duganella sp. sic0402]